MKKMKWFWSLAFVCVAMNMQAQETAVKQVAGGHYIGARQQLKQYLNSLACDEKGTEDAEALALVCDYVLDSQGVAERLGRWVELNPLSPYAPVLKVLQRNRLIKEARFDEALELFFAHEGETIATPLAYPLTSLSEELDSYNEVLYRLAGERLYDENRYEHALPYLEVGEKTRASEYKLGMCYYQLGQYGKAFETLQTAAGSYQDELAQNAWLHAGIAALQQGRKDEAQQAFAQASGIMANHSLREQALYNYALTLHEKKAPQTVAVMEGFLHDYPTSPYATPVSQCLTEVYMTKKDYSKALTTISRVQAPTAETQADKQKVLYNLAAQELNQGRVQQALTYAVQSVGLGNQDAATYAESFFIKGDCNYRLGNYAQAANDLNTAIRLGEQTPEGRLKNRAYAAYSLAYAQFKQQKYNNAIASFQRVLAMDDADKAMRADAYNRIGDSYLNMRNYAEANANYAEAKATDHTLGDYAMLQQAYIEGLKGNYDQKVALLHQLRTEYPASRLTAQALYEQGRAYILSGKEEEAASVFSQIALNYPQSDYAQKASEELQTMAANIAMRDSIAKAQDSIAIEEAKAPVLEAMALYEAGQYQQAEQRLNQAIDNGIGKPYWLARAFVLLSDIYAAEDRKTEAVQTLESLKENYQADDDIRSLIEKRLEGLNQ